MSDDEVIRFEITDYDLDNEFNPNRNRRPNKEQQIYGVWAKDSDEEDNEDIVRQRNRKPKDFSAPIGFIAGGFQQAGKKKEEKKELQEKAASTSRVRYADSSDEETSAPAESETAGIRKAGQGMRGVNFGGNVGAWEKHTKGIGAKLLLQMGYQPGKGLGKDLQGISAPVEATMRKGRGAIGAYGPEKAAQKAKKEEEKRLKEKEEEDKGTKEKTYNWKKSHKGRYFYKDAADVIQEGKPTMHTISSSELSRVPVIDMTGRERRVLSGYHALRAAAPRYEHEPRRACTRFQLPELTHNLQLVLDCCEQDIIQNARELQQAEDEIVVLERDLEECDAKSREEDEIVQRMEAVLQRVEILNNPDISLDDAFKVVSELKESYPAEYEMFKMDGVVVSAVRQPLQAQLACWRPLDDPALALAPLQRWRPLLAPDSFEELLMQHFMPAVAAAAQTWEPRSPAAMLALVETWREVAPRRVLRALVAQLVPRLLAALRAWDPTRDTLPVHTWVLPWHELAAEELAASAYPLIRARLATALGAWHPADQSARPLLAAWRHAWPSTLPALLHLHVLPKLEHCLQTSTLDLLTGENVAWRWCVPWAALAGGAALAALCCRALLPRWLSALAAWLNSAPPHATVLAAYTNFKRTFPEEILKEPAVRDAFRKALDMMNRSTDIDTVEPPPPPRFTLPDTRETKLDIISSLSQQKSFSELLESRCIEKGITFVPIAGKSREGRPLYKIGDLQCYVIRNVIMYSEDNGRTFLPIGMEKLLSMVDD